MSETTTTAAATTQTPAILPLLDRVAIVTGASRGIGQSIAVHLASLGARVAVVYASSATEAENVTSIINSAASSGSTQLPRAIAVCADVSNVVQVKSLFDTAEREFGTAHIHIIVNNAGTMDSSYPPIAATSDESWDRTFNTNTKGVFLCSREAANRLKHGGGGRIVNLSTSLVGALMPGYGAYTASKAAVEAMTKILAKELKGTGITANCVAPGPVATELFFAGKTEETIQRMIQMNPMGRLGMPEDIASVVGFLVGDSGGWVNGQVIRANGGYV